MSENNWHLRIIEKFKFSYYNFLIVSDCPNKFDASHKNPAPWHDASTFSIKNNTRTDLLELKANGLSICALKPGQTFESCEHELSSTPKSREIISFSLPETENFKIEKIFRSSTRCGTWKRISSVSSCYKTTRRRNPRSLKKVMTNLWKIIEFYMLSKIVRDNTGNTPRDNTGTTPLKRFQWFRFWVLCDVLDFEAEVGWVDY